MNYKIKSYIYDIILFTLVILIDQLSKAKILTILTYEGYSIPILDPFLRFTLVYNEGVTFGMLKNVSSIIMILVILCVLLFLVYSYLNIEKDFHTKMQCRLIHISHVLILAGACGNLLDRFIRGAVVDFLDFGLPNVRWYIFNIADSSIVIGIILYLIVEIYRKKTHKKVK